MDVKAADRVTLPLHAHIEHAAEQRAGNLDAEHVALDGPEREAEWHDLFTALRRAVDEVLTARQRQVFVAVVLNGIPGDALMHEFGTTRNAIYKTLYDARRKLRAELAGAGHLDANAIA